jgi:UDP-hydrolysing UDP-N-acetyl-D-glucosamine 2-epimerase
MSLRVAWVSTCRSDYGASRWVIHDLHHDPRFDLQMIVGGSHLSGGPEATVAEIERDGWPIGARVPFAPTDDSPAGFALAHGLALAGFVDAYTTLRPDVVALYGDRLELLPAAHAALLTRTPIAHLCGGDVTEGALDDQVRHAITKLAHVHFPSSARSAERIRQMGEEPWRVHAVGDPALDHYRRGTRASVDELAAALGFRPDARTLVVTLHPTTAAPEAIPLEARALADALRAYDGTIVITAPAPDPGAAIIRKELLTLVGPKVVFVESLGSERYRGLLAIAGAMVGNSSSGLNEAPCVPLPVVNVGRRQQGRDRARNVVDAPSEAGALRRAIEQVLAPAFRASLRGLESPYGDGRASQAIVAVLATLPARPLLLDKHFSSLAAPQDPTALGGDFALDGPLEAGDAGAFASGRDALAVVVHGRAGRWLVPAFLCPVVADTLRAAGCDVAPYPWLTPWRVDGEALAPLLAGAVGIVVPSYLGLDPDDEIWRGLAGAHLCVVEDRCQCVELEPEFLAASAQLADDAVRLRSAAGLIRWARNRLTDSSGSLERAQVELFRSGEATFGSGSGRRASRAARTVAASLDVAAIRARRIRNQRWLAGRVAQLPSVELVEPAPGSLLQIETPLLALPVASDDRDALRARLAQQRIYCAIHWVDGDWSGAGGRAAEWSRRLLSLPIDQRWELVDLQRIVEVLAR